MNKEIIEDHKNQEEEISPIEKQLMKFIKEYGLDPENAWRIDKDKEIYLDKESFLKYYDTISYWQLPTPEEELNYLILPYIEFKYIYYESPIKAKGNKWLSNLPGLNLSRIEFMDMLSEEALRGKLGNKYCEKISSSDEKTSSALHDHRIWPQEDLNLNNIKLLGGIVYW
ncbi:hypothetical protein O181_079791 [Austropuccinia psidii MF-1]|uniref:Uncharacterized protein n=1 Tax=Austropuccinia psidii MF-1 TaxID=1389203 RepID=A0A9Q3FGZ2_9BASI|nr:hypothetical protein [Austropuccinia psidii MF-1]